MTKHVVISAIVLGLLSSAGVQAADDFSSMISKGKTSGQIREFSIVRNIEKSAANDSSRSANAIGGYLKFETADYDGLTIGAAAYGTSGFLMPEIDADTTEDPTLLGKDNEGYGILGEAYLQYKTGNTIFKGGRQKLATPLAGADDARMVPNLFEAYLLINSDVENTTLIAGHVTKFAQGTFGRAYGAGGILGVTSGYSATDASNQVGKFVNMGTYATDESTDGVSVISASYKNGAIKAQVWDYIAHDILNAVYADASISWNCIFNDIVKPFAAVQLIKENGLADYNIDSLFYGAKVGAKIGGFTGYLAFSKQSKADNLADSFNSAIITPWGGMPAYTQGMVTRHMFLAGTTASKAAVSYNFKNLGLKAVGYYATFAMDDNNGYTHGDASESGFDFIYNMKAVKGLQLRLRGNYAEDFKVADITGATVGWNEYRFIMNYTF